ncbi:MAG: ribonuclease R [Rhodospirillaceae bacterium]|nr:ribonuclease R [Rhodospirillaceae bacterium]MBT5660366.1 ribonuclease R [Rhodospirillaceae bacterium]MBT5753017.1 ribonuclease R [Rhodospirillaceae bacterium]
MPKDKSAPHLPSKEDILDHIRNNPERVGKREIGRAFGIKAADRVWLKKILREMKDEGLIDHGKGRRLEEGGQLPPVGIIEIMSIDSDGELIGRPTVWHDVGDPPRVLMAPERRGRPAIAPGDRVLARLNKLDETTYEGRTIRLIAGAPQEIIGVYRLGDRQGRIESTDRRHKSEFLVSSADSGDAQEGQLVLADILPGRRHGLPQARIKKAIGTADDPGAISLIAIHAHDIPTVFPKDVLAQAEKAKPVSLGEREDLRHLPLVTIDGADARDFDDAVFAEPDPDPANAGGWHMIVAIADVAHYVQAGDPLDREAEKRGNSTYFPDRVVPMLPEALSNGLCSLRPDEDHPCLAVHMWIDSMGQKRNHRFLRGIMRSKARLTYESVDAAHKGGGASETDSDITPLADHIAALYGAFKALAKAKKARHALDLDLPDFKIVLDDNAQITGIEPRMRLDSHRLIEEFMILANVAAAETLEEKKTPCMYRIHEPPGPAKVEPLREFLDSLGYKLAAGAGIRPEHFSGILTRAHGTEHMSLVSEIILRSQSKAEYNPNNAGHFGLALSRYAHFTSPIRRYSDLLVHRALIDAQGLGKDGLGNEATARFAEIAEYISKTERRSEAAERDANDRYTVAYLAEKVGAKFYGRINGVTHFGLFVTLKDTGADGLVPIRSLGDDYYIHDEARHCLRGRNSGEVFSMGDLVEVRLAEANPVTGGMVFEILRDGQSIGRSTGRTIKRATGRSTGRGTGGKGKPSTGRGGKGPSKRNGAKQTGGKKRGKRPGRK